MKYLSHLLTVCVCAVFLLAGDEASAQSTSSVRTRVGTPPAQSSSCPIPNGIPSCGSKNVPVNTSTSGGLCGHCGAGYGSFSCAGLGDGIYYAMDVPSVPPNTPLSPVYMPSLGGENIQWVFSHQYLNNSLTAIQYYMGTNENTGEQYWIQFHHTQPGSGGGSPPSGEEGARLCAPGCSTGSGPHVHIEFAKVLSSGQKVWQDAPDYFCAAD